MHVAPPFTIPHAQVPKVITVKSLVVQYPAAMDLYLSKSRYLYNSSNSQCNVYTLPSLTIKYLETFSSAHRGVCGIVKAASQGLR
jgi:hypothetical protein